MVYGVLLTFTLFFLGCWGSGQDPSSVAALLRRNPGLDICSRLC